MDQQLNIEDTFLLAKTLHEGQKDKGGHPYIGHVQRVFERTQAHLSTLPFGMLTFREHQDILRAALLHDTVEDTKMTVEGLIELRYEEGVTRRVERLSGRPEGMTYHKNIQNMADEGDIGVILIKLSDNEDNADPARIAQLPEEERSIVNRYNRSMVILAAARDRLIEQFRNAQA